MNDLTDKGERPVARCDLLGAVPYSMEEGALARPYLTSAHKAALGELSGWMEAAGMSVRLDPVANLVGRYEGREPGAPALLIGSHIDSVRDGGRYDGALGVMIGVELADHFHRADKRLPFAIEVVAFGDEEGSRFPSSMLCSRALVEGVRPAVLETRDEAGVSIAEALRGFGLDPGRAASARRQPREVVAYLEAHIEQGPVLEAENLPVGNVVGIAAQLRLKARFTGQAGHAGTTPMGLRQDAVAAAAEAILEVERVAAAGGSHLVGTVGRITTSTQAFNVIVGECEIGIDVRAADKGARDAAAAKIREAIEAIAARRGVGLDFQEVQDLPGAPCDPGLMALMDEAIAETGVRPFRMMSGAGHDAMVMGALAPVAMLFIRCAGGVSHNPAEAVEAGDVSVAVKALAGFIEKLAEASA